MIRRLVKIGLKEEIALLLGVLDKPVTAPKRSRRRPFHAGQ